ncbi:copper transport outer membrane protein MctB [Kineococcus xinjiangensis]|uniref:Copper transport outer membrane protein MctB n=1 Tax=Kineococcus xinjiangensis TaxID=512762 RepID=A0A2S6ICA7_9ACTN|nr:copper transporter [Kineococcus xinjiangensis]PPK90863.1 copper transport outer membrane protein MctB [Kineococcus xinjiangensis]
MIDFRYHLVSLVSVFMALAVGIVLGAGPLKEGIDVGITDQIRQLTAEKADLREQLDAADRAIAAREEWTELVAPEVVAGELAGESVVLVLLPGAEPAAADQIAETVTTAGAEVTGRVTIQDTWTAPDAEDVREAVAAELRAQTGQTPPAGEDGSVGAVLAATLAQAVVTEDGDDDASATPATAVGISALMGAGLLSGEVSGPATLAVLVAGPADPGPAAEETAAVAESLTALAVRLDVGARGAVVAGPVTASAEEGLIAAIRADPDASTVVSTVDDADLPMGRTSVALALREQADGGVGHYGIATSAEAVSPPLRQEEPDPQQEQEQEPEQPQEPQEPQEPAP